LSRDEEGQGAGGTGKHVVAVVVTEKLQLSWW